MIARPETSDERFKRFAGYWRTASIIAELKDLSPEEFWSFYEDLNEDNRKKLGGWLNAGGYPITHLQAVLKTAAEKLIPVESFNSINLRGGFAFLSLLEVFPLLRQQIYNMWFVSLQSEQVDPILQYIEMVFQTIELNILDVCYDLYPQTTNIFSLTMLCSENFPLKKKQVDVLFAHEGIERLLASNFLGETAMVQVNPRHGDFKKRHSNIIGNLKSLFFSENKFCLDILKRHPRIARELYTATQYLKRTFQALLPDFQPNFHRLSAAYTDPSQFLQEQSQFMADGEFIIFASLLLAAKKDFNPFTLTLEQLIKIIANPRTSREVFSAIVFDDNLWRMAYQYYSETPGFDMAMLYTKHPMFYSRQHISYQRGISSSLELLSKTDLNSEEAKSAKQDMISLIGQPYYFMRIKQDMAVAATSWSWQHIQFVIQQVKLDKFKEEMLDHYIEHIFSDPVEVTGKFNEMYADFYNNMHGDYSALCKAMTENNRKKFEVKLLTSDAAKYSLLRVMLEQPSSHAVIKEHQLSKKLVPHIYDGMRIQNADIDNLFLAKTNFPEIEGHYKDQIKNRVKQYVAMMKLPALIKFYKKYPLEEEVAHRFIELIKEAEEATVREMDTEFLESLFLMDSASIPERYHELCRYQVWLLDAILKSPKCTVDYIKRNKNIFYVWCNENHVHLQVHVSSSDLKKLAKADGGIDTLLRGVDAIRAKLELSSSADASPAGQGFVQGVYLRKK